MNCIFLLSGDYPDLAKEEILSLFDVKEYSLSNRLLIADLKNDLSSLMRLGKRLALTKGIYKLLFECKAGELADIMKKYDWNSIYKDNFCLRINEIKKIVSPRNHFFADYSEKNLAGYIWNALKKPSVNLENPKTKIELFFIKHNVYCGLLLHTNNEDFESRSPHLRAFPHPGSLAPKVARALVNLTGIKENETLLDPFCGTGGFLIEAGLMGIKAMGYDINRIMSKGCRENMKNLKIKNFKIFSANALRILHKFDYVATDLPYGLNSNALLEYKKLSWKKYRINKKIQKENFQSEIENFYLMFLKNLKKILKKKAVITFPSYVNYKSLLKAAGFKIEKEFSIYVHRSLTRRIVKIE